MKQDRFLLGILAAIGVLVVAALVLFFSRGTQDYLPEDSPAAIVHNYVLALERKDFERAYSYLSDRQHKPEFIKFRQYFTYNQGPTSTGLQIGTTSMVGDQAVVELTVVHVSNSVFDSGWRENASATLEQTALGWKLTQMPYNYWGSDWYSPPPTKPAALYTPSGE